MSVERINQLHAEVEATHSTTNRIDDLLCELDDKINKTKQELTMHERKLQKLEREHRSAWDKFDARVIEIGKLLASDKEEFGKSWKKEFSTRGFSFSYSTAIRYMACAKHPEASENTQTLEEWAKASSAMDRANDPKRVEQELARVARAKNRKPKNADRVEGARTERFPSEEELEVDCSATLPIPQNLDAVKHAISLLDQSILKGDKYFELREPWLLLSSTFSQLITPLEITESSELRDDSVDIGGSDSDEEDHEFPTKPLLRLMDGLNCCNLDPKAIGVA